MEWCIQFIQPGHLPEISKKIWDLLDIDLNTRLFYENIISKARTTGENYIAVVVSHIIPDAVHYLRAIDTIFPIQTIVPKPNSIDEKTYDRSEGF